VTLYYYFYSFSTTAGKNLREALITLEEDLAQLSDKLQLEAQSIPNSTHPDVPVGGEESSVVRKEVEHFCTYFLLVIALRTFVILLLELYR
jgi:seryl-tRNA synthetase